LSATPAIARAAGRKGHPPESLLLYGLLGAMVFFWSLNFVVGKWALREFPPLLLGGLRCTIAGAIMLPVYLISARRSHRPRSWRWREVPMLLGLGVLGVAMNQVFFVMGLSRTSVAHASILVGAGPIMVLLAASAIGMERITAGKTLGMLIAVAGVGVLEWSPEGRGSASLLGNAFVLLSSAAFAVFTVAGKRISRLHGTITVSTFAYVGGALSIAPLTLALSAHFDFARVSAAGWASLLYMAAFPSVAAYLIYYWALTHIAASRVAAFCYFQPLAATLLAIPLLGDSVTATLAAGGALVLAGVWITERS
jgi:drug/metabolite transporter (DMT)-like permease